MTRTVNELKEIWKATAKKIQESNFVLAEDTLQSADSAKQIEACVMQMQNNFEQALEREGITNEEKIIIKENVKTWINEIMQETFEEVSKKLKPKLNEALIKKGK